MLAGQAIPEVEDQNDLSEDREQSDSDSDRQSVQDESNGTVMAMQSKRQRTKSLSD